MMKKNRNLAHWPCLYLFVLGLWLCGGWAWPVLAQPAQKSLWQKVRPDSAFVKSYYRQWCFTGQNTFQNALFNLISFNGEQSLSYQTNMSLGAGLTVDYKWFTLGFSRNVGYIDLYSPPQGKGISTHSSLQAGYTGRRLWLQGTWHRYDGFFLVGATDTSIVPPPARLRALPRPDAQLDAWFATLTYALRPHRYSHMASLWQLEQQLRSAGTPTLGLMVNFYTTRADSSLVPAKLRGAFAQGAGRNLYTYANLFFTGGYVHTFVLARVLFANMGIWGGLGPQINRQAQSSLGMAVNMDVLLTLGYNGRRLFGGVQVQGRTFMNQLLEGEPTHYVFASGRGFVGLRLGRVHKVQPTGQ